MKRNEKKVSDVSEKMMKVTAIHTHTHTHCISGLDGLRWTAHFAPRLCLLLLQHRSRTCPTLVEGPAFPIISLSLHTYAISPVTWLGMKIRVRSFAALVTDPKRKQEAEPNSLSVWYSSFFFSGHVWIYCWIKNVCTIVAISIWGE